MAREIGIRFRNLDRTLQDRIGAATYANLSGAPQLKAGATREVGILARDVLRLAANVADAETIVISPDTYEIETVATATGSSTAGGQLNHTNDIAQVTITAHGLVAGDPVAVESEIMTVLSVVDVNTVLLARGRFGTTIAAHANAIAINKGNGITAGRIPVGFIATFTPAVAGPAIAAAINNAALTNGVRPTGKVSTIFNVYQAQSLASGAEVLLFAKTPQADARAVSETLAGGGNAWDAATLEDGAAPSDKRRFEQAIVPITAEVTAGRIQVPLPFTPRVILIQVVVTATGVPVAWNGAALFASGVLTIDNTGATDWATTSTLYVYCSE